jgi:quercetin dioxygenase-like cupin family protein
MVRSRNGFATRERVFVKRLNVPSLGGVVGLLLLSASAAAGQLEPPCVPDSPERRGEIGCSVVEIKNLPDGLEKSLFWHIDRFDSGERARAAIGPTSIALEAHGAWWLLTLEPKIGGHHGGRHEAAVRLPTLPVALKYSMLVISANIPAGLTSRIHNHSGVEAFYVVDGEQCLETPTRAYRMRKGGTLAIAAEVTMRLVATGSKPRRGLAVIVYDASRPPTTRMEENPALASCE